MDNELKIQSDSIYAKGYGTIPKLVMQDKNLHVIAKAIYAYIKSFAGAGDTCFPSRKKMCEDLGLNKDTYAKYLNQLKELNYIDVVQTKANGKFSTSTFLIRETIENTVSEMAGHGETDTNNNIYIYNNNSNNNNKRNYNKENVSDELKRIVEEVINYMNEIGGTSFLSTSKKTITLISARLKDGFSEEDLKDVVFYKCRTWKENPMEFSNGRKSDYYYKPTTLFSSENFEGYLQEYRNQLNKWKTLNKLNMQ